MHHDLYGIREDEIDGTYRTCGKINAYKILVRKPGRNPRYRWEDNIKMQLKEM
jgi:hypothetical protein